MPLSRRSFITLAGATFVAGTFGMGSDNHMDHVPPDLDHILLGVSDLDHGIAWLEERSGVRAVFGGVHPGRGTRNALLSLGPRRYLEIIAPDPAQTGPLAAGPGPTSPKTLAALQQPQLVGWAAHTDDIAALAKSIASAGINASGVREGSRARPDGKLLQWKSLGLNEDYRGLLPFFIEWNRASVHPSVDAPPGVTLQSLAAESPEHEIASRQAKRLELGITIRAGKEARLRAVLRGKKGEFELS